MRALYDAYALIVALLGCTPAIAAETFVKDIETRPGVTQRIADWIKTSSREKQ